MADGSGAGADAADGSGADAAGSSGGKKEEGESMVNILYTYMRLHSIVCETCIM